MRLRKVFAGIAAAATMLGGLALGATTASAAEVASNATGSITLSGATAANTTYTAYKIGSYTGVEGADDNATSVTVTTVAAWKSDAETVLGTNATSTSAYKAYGDPLAYVAGTSLYSSANSAELSVFVDGLAGKLDGKIEAAHQDVTADNATVTFSDLPQGLYLVVATQTGPDPVTSAGKALAIIGTQVTDVDGNEYTTLGKNSYELGKATVKPTTPQVPTKDHKIVDGDEYYVGKTVKYTLTGTIPQYISANGEFKFVDTPGTGLTVSTDASNFSVTVDSQNILFTVNPAGQTIKGDGSTSFTIAVTAPARYAGKTVTVTYDAVINNEATGKVENKLDLDNQSTTDVFDTDVKTNSFSFQKVGVDDDATGLNGATFTLSVVSTENNVGLPADYDTTATSATVNGKDGVVSFSNLPNGTYTVQETAGAEGYLNNNPTFTVTVKDGTVTISKDATGDPFDLVTVSVDKLTATVLNVKKITELPLTGAAGTALFTIIGVLLAGAAVTVFAKSRSAKRALTA